MLSSILYKIRRTISLIVRYPKSVKEQSYYSESERKSLFHVLKDQLFILWKYGDTEPFYYTYGFDRIDMTREKMVKE